MKHNIMMLSILLLVSSCVNTQLVCKAIPEFNTVTLCSVSFKYEKCTCWEYDYEKQKSISDPIQMSFDECPETIIGYTAEDFAVELKPNIKKLDRLHENLCQ